MFTILHYFNALALQDGDSNYRRLNDVIVTPRFPGHAWVP